MPANSQHPTYVDALRKWSLVRAVIDNDAQEYIYTVDEGDPLRSKKYRQDAVLYNFTALTKNGLLGLIYLHPPKVTLPPQLEYLTHNATGGGLSLDQLSQQICGDLLETGRYGLLIDYMGVNNNGTARIIPYSAESIINWHTGVVNGLDQFSMVVLQETFLWQQDDNDEFNLEYRNQYRVLKMVQGVYVQELYDRNLELINRTIPTKANGDVWNEIPFVILGSEHNTPVVDNATLYDLAVLNISQYKNSADYEESIFVTGQPTVVVNVGDIPADQWKELNGGRFKFGSRGGHVVGAGGDAKLLQASPNQLAAKAMQDKLLVAVGIGARLISPPGGRETAEAARIRYSSQNSALMTLTQNVNNGIEDALSLCCEFVLDATPSDIKYELNDQFYEDGVDATLLAQAMLMFDRGILTSEEIRDYVETSGAGLIEESDIPEPTDLDLPLSVNPGLVLEPSIANTTETESDLMAD